MQAKKQSHVSKFSDHNKHDNLNFIHVFVHFLCTPKENEPKEKALSRQVFFEEIIYKISSKTIF